MSSSRNSEPRRWRQSNPDNRIVEALGQFEPARPPPGAEDRILRATLAQAPAASRRALQLRHTVGWTGLTTALGAAVALAIAVKGPVSRAPAALAASPARSSDPTPSLAAPALAPTDGDESIPAPGVTRGVAHPAASAGAQRGEGASRARPTALAKSAPGGQRPQASLPPNPRRGPLPLPSAVRPPLPFTAEAGAPPPEPDRLDNEALRIQGALEALRSDRSPRAALLVLDDYDRTFPAGSLRGNAKLLRVEALLALDRDAEALEVLQPRNLAQMGRPDELLTLRGELLLKQGRVAEALPCFEAARRSAQPEVAERAQRGWELARRAGRAE